MADAQGLIVRKSVRLDIALPALLRIDSEHAGAVRFGPASGQRDGWVEADVVDLSGGGVGLIMTQFVPSGCMVVVRVFGHDGREHEALFELRGEVRRVLMTDRRPAYLVGVSLDTMDEGSLAALEGLLDDAG